MTGHWLLSRTCEKTSTCPASPRERQAQNCPGPWYDAGLIKRGNAGTRMDEEMFTPMAGACVQHGRPQASCGAVIQLLLARKSLFGWAPSAAGWYDYTATGVIQGCESECALSTTASTNATPLSPSYASGMFLPIAVGSRSSWRARIASAKPLYKLAKASR